MSTRATVYIHWYDSDMLDIKLYHHWDWYVEYLGVELEKALEKWRKWYNRYNKNWYKWRYKTLIECIASIGGFEPAYPIHGDVEYIYHINYGVNNWKARYELFAQNGYGEQNILDKTPKILLCMNWYKRSMNKKLNRKQAEKDLGTGSHWVAWYLDD